MTDVSGDGIASPSPSRLCNLHAARITHHVSRFHSRISLKPVERFTRRPAIND
jgi:hypothetical protein